MQINKLQISQQKYTADLGRASNILELFGSEPTLMNSVVVRLRGGMNDPIGYITDGLGNITKVKNPGQGIKTINWRWPLQGDTDKPIKIISYNSSTSTPGIRGSEFSITVEENWFAEGDVLAFDNPNYLARIHTDPVEDGNGHWILRMKVTKNDASYYIPEELLQPDRYVTKDYTLVAAEGSEKGGKSHFSTPFEMENVLGTLRKTYSVTRLANTMVSVVDIYWTDPETKKQKSTKMWAHAHEMAALDQFMIEKEKYAWYSEYSGNELGQHKLKDAAGHLVFSGAGIREQISDANRRYYTDFSEDLIRDYMMDLSYNSLDKSNRKFICFTGEMGFDVFDRAMQNSLRGWQPIESGLFVDGDKNSLGYGNQFTTYRGLNGTEVTLKHLPLYDEEVRGGRYVHRTSRRPIDSYRMTFLDLGYNNDNIKKVYLEGSEMLHWEVSGSVSATQGNATNKTSRATSKDYYTVEMLTTCGIQITNPLSCGELICDNAELV